MKEESPSTTRLSVAIVLYHSPVKLLLSTICSLYEAAQIALNEGQLGGIKLTLIDNSQCREYETSLRTALGDLALGAFFELNYTKTAHNGGFGGGHNRVLPTLDSDYHLILNPDVELAESALLVGLSTLQGDPGLTLVCPRVVGSSGEQEFLCKSYPSVLVLLLRAFAPAFIRDYFRVQLDAYEMRDAYTGDQPQQVLLASGCFMLLRSSALLEVGGFNEKYFLYFEDFDLSLRLGEQGRLRFLPTMQIVHHGGYAASKGIRHIWLFIKSGFRFFNDHGWKWI